MLAIFSPSSSDCVMDNFLLLGAEERWTETASCSKIVDGMEKKQIKTRLIIASVLQPFLLNPEKNKRDTTQTQTS